MADTISYLPIDGLCYDPTVYGDAHAPRLSDEQRAALAQDLAA